MSRVGVVDAANGSNGIDTVEDNGPALPARASQAAVILGNDAIVAARPFSPFQLANACRAAGFDIVVPPSWGDELIASAYLERLADCRDVVAIACNCERVRPLLPAIASLAGHCGVAIAAPPIAAARYLRLTYGESVLVTYVGDCPSADDATIDARFSPSGFFASLERQGIAIGGQPDTMPEGEAERWQRHRSMPGGLPARRWLARPPVDRLLREVDSQGVAPYRSPSSLRSNVLLDLTEASACACGGNRAVIEEREGDRSVAPIVVAPPGLDLTDAPSLSRSGVTAHTSRARPEREEVHRAQPDQDSSPIATPSLEAQQATSTEETVEESAPASLDPAPLASALANIETATPSVEPMAQAATVEQEPKVPAPPAQQARSTRWEARRVAQAAAERRQRAIALVAVPTLVLLMVAALGAGAYTLSTRGRAPATAATGESSAARSTALQPDTSPSRIVPRIDSVSASGSVPSADTLRIAKDSTQRADSASGDSLLAPRDSAAQAALNRARRRRALEIVPGWMPQGQKSWTPADSVRARKPDSTTTRPKPDTLPPA